VSWEDGWPVVNAGLGRLDVPVPAAGQWESSEPVASDFLGVRDVPQLDDRTLTGTLLRRLTSTDSTVSITLDEITATAGLVLRQSDAANVRIEVSADSTVALIDSGATIATGTLAPGPVTLAATLAPSGITWTAAGTELGHTPLSSVSTETAGGFVGTTFGPYAVGGTALFAAWSQTDRS
jgi:hypothetical protein